MSSIADPDPVVSVKKQVLALLSTGELRADGRLPTERELSERFDVGRRFVRRALDQLEADGLVWRRQGKGTFAGQPSDPTGELAARITGETNALQVMEARLCIEPELAALCARRACAEEVDRMRRLAQRQFESGDPQAMELWDGALHRLIAQCARNKPLLTAFALLDEIRCNPEWVAMRARARTRASLQVTSNEHLVIIDAIAAGQPEAARAAMHDHLSTRFAALQEELGDVLEMQESSFFRQDLKL